MSVSTLRVYEAQANRKKLPGIPMALAMLKSMVILTGSVNMAVVVQSLLQFMLIAQESEESILLVTTVFLIAGTLNIESHWPR